MSLNRRYFLSLDAGTTAALAAPAIIGMAKPRVIVIGGVQVARQPLVTSPKTPRARST